MRKNKGLKVLTSLSAIGRRYARLQKEFYLLRLLRFYHDLEMRACY